MIGLILLLVLYLLAVFLYKRKTHQRVALSEKKKKEAEGSFVNRSAEALENQLTRLPFVGKQVAHYKNLGLPEEYSLGYLVILNFLVLFLAYNISNIADINFFLISILVLLIESAVLFFVFRRGKAALDISKSLPELFDTLANTYEVYPDLKNSIEEAYVSVKHPASRHLLSSVRKHIAMGYSADEALLALAKSFQDNTITFVVSSMHVQLATGSDIPRFLRRTSERLRRQAANKAEIAQILFENKISSIVAAALPIGMLFLSAATSANYRQFVFVDPTGRVVLIAALTWWAIGAAIVYKSINIRV